jgi:cell division protein FtsB
MARQTYAKLKSRIVELEEENQNLNDKLDSILDIASSESGDEDDDDSDDDDSEDDEG